jgi:hypothetical protein
MDADSQLNFDLGQRNLRRRLGHLLEAGLGVIREVK